MTFLESPSHSSTLKSSCDNEEIHLPGVVGTPDTTDSSDEDDTASATGDPTNDADEIGCGAAESALVDANDDDDTDSILTN